MTKVIRLSIAMTYAGIWAGSSLVTIITALTGSYVLAGLIGVFVGIVGCSYYYVTSDTKPL